MQRTIRKARGTALLFNTTCLVWAGCGSLAAQEAPASQVVLTPVEVTGEGRAQDVTQDYKVNRVSIGPFGKKPLLDTPFSVNTISQDLAENQQLQSLREAFRYIPSVQGENIRPQTRGLQSSVVQNTLIDGLNIAATTDYPLEQFERIDVLNGLAGALFGPAQPGGTFNYVMKRPTETPLQRFTGGYLTQGQWFGHADIGGYIDAEKRFGYRLNLLNQDGVSFVDNGQLRRQLASFGGDIRLTPQTVIEGNASIYHYRTKGLPGTFSLATGVRFPNAFSPTRVGYGQPWGGDDNLTSILSLRVKHDFNTDWSITGGIMRNTSDRASTVPTNTITNNNGAYTTTAATTTFSLDQVVSNQIALNGRFFTGPLKHEAFLANNGFFWDRYTPYSTGALTAGSGNIYSPLVFAQPNFPDFKNRYRSVNTIQQSITLGDTIAFNEQWSVMGAISDSWINVHNYSRTNATTSFYDANGWSPLASLMFKPQSNQTAYFTYANSLQQGDAAPAGTVNAGQALAPYRSNQYELGYKIDFGRINVNAALYRVERPYAYTGTNNVFAIQGTQINRGIELMASGAINDQFTLYGGMTFIDPRLYNTGSPTTEGRRILGLSQFVMNTLLEYHVPTVQGLTLTGNVTYATNRPGDNANTFYVSGFATLDLGLRYVQLFNDHKLTFRANLYNVTDTRYWANITPSSQNGYNAAGASTGTLGNPRTIRISIQADL